MFHRTTSLTCGMSLYLASFVIVSLASADSTHGKRYVGANLGFYEQDLNASDAASITSIEGRVGGFLNNNAALELRLGAGVIGDEIASRDIDLDYVFGAYTRVGLPIDKVFPYVLAGFTRSQLSYSSPELEDSETDVSFGIGIDLQVSNLTVNLEYAQLVDNAQTDLSGFAFGFTTTF